VSYEAPAPRPVTVVTPLQARRALAPLFLRDTVEAWIDQQPRGVRDARRYAGDVYRDDPTLVAAAEALSITDEELDDLFALGATL